MLASAQQNESAIHIHIFPPLQKQRHRGREQMYGYQGGKGWGGRNWEIGIDTYTLLILCIK